MHSAEQILRAELAEKKNAESEIQWLELKADCEERSRFEIGFPELGMTDKTDGSDVEFWSPRVTLFWSLSSRSERRPTPQS